MNYLEERRSMLFLWLERSRAESQGFLQRSSDGRIPEGLTSV